MIVFLAYAVKTGLEKSSTSAGTYSCTLAFSSVLVLASSSPYRRMLLDRLRLAYTVAVPDVDESALRDEAAEATARRLAALKAQTIAARYPDAVIIAYDQVATLDGTQIGKPGHHAAALAQLLAMRGRSVVFHAALCVHSARGGGSRVESVPTIVSFREYSQAQAERYLEIERPY